MPLGSGYTAEEQLSGEASHGGIQIIAYPMKREVYDQLMPTMMRFSRIDEYMLCEAGAEFGLAPGGLMRQEIYEDPHGVDAWDISQPSRCFVHILNSAQYQADTGKTSPGKPLTADEYTNAGR